jgi:hypothetical protein
MKIFFCDVCNESIPVKLVQEGQVSTVKGKVICPKCLPVVAPPPIASEGASVPTEVPGTGRMAAAPRSSSRAGMALGIGACILGAAGVLGVTSLHREQEALRARIAESTSGIPALIQTLAEMEVRAGQHREAEGRRFTAFELELERTRRSLDAIEVLRRDLDAETKRWEGRKLELEAAQVQALAQALDPLRSQAVRIEASVSKLAAESSTQRNELARLAGRVDVLGGRAAEGAPEAAPAPGGPGAGEAVALKDLPAPIAKQVQLLNDGDASKVWAALTELGNTPDPRVIPYVVPTLSHGDPFVRHQAMTLLGDLNAKEAIEPLIQGLGDEEPWVREGAHTALRKITRQNLRFDTHASREQRAEAKSAWEKWWQANREKLLGS